MKKLTLTHLAETPAAAGPAKPGRKRPAGKIPARRGVIPFFKPVQPMAGAPAALRREGKTARDKARRHSKRAA